MYQDLLYVCKKELPLVAKDTLSWFQVVRKIWMYFSYQVLRETSQVEENQFKSKDSVFLVLLLNFESFQLTKMFNPIVPAFL